MNGLPRALCKHGHPLEWWQWWNEPELGHSDHGPVYWREDLAAVLLCKEDGREVERHHDVVCHECFAVVDQDDVRVPLERALHAAYRAEPIAEPLTSGSDTLDRYIAQWTQIVRTQHPEFTIDVARGWAIECIKTALSKDGSA